MIQPNHTVERTASQPVALVGEVGVLRGWLAVAHFRRSADHGVSDGTDD